MPGGQDRFPFGRIVLIKWEYRLVDPYWPRSMHTETFMDETLPRWAPAIVIWREFLTGKPMSCYGTRKARRPASKDLE